MIICRGYVGNALIFQKRVDDGLSDEVMRQLLRNQFDRLRPYPKHIIEVEFPDAPGVFLRHGTDSSGMIKPRQVRVRDATLWFKDQDHGKRPRFK